MNDVFKVLKKELREVFRDKKSLAMMLVMPIMIPLLVIGLSALFDVKTEVDINDYNQIGFAYEVSDIEKSIIEEMELDATYGTVDEIKEAFDKKEIYAYIENEGNNYVINYDATSEDGSYTASMAQEFLNTYKYVLQEQYLTNNGLESDAFFNPITIEEKEIAQQSFYASYIVNYSFLFIIMAIVVSATYPATDATAGEKERGTLETLLTMPIRAKDIIIGKLLSVSISSILTGLLSLLLCFVSFEICNNSFEIYKNGPIEISGMAFVMSVFVIIALSIFISDLCIGIAGMSKSFKEAQSALTPLTFVCFFPGMIAFMLELETTSLLSIIPFLNYSMIFTDISNGIYNYGHIILMVGSTLIYIVIVVVYIVRQYQSEKILFAK